MEATKRKYTKKNNEGKITVKHYLNTRLKPVRNINFSPDSEKGYPIYIRVIVSGRGVEIKSKIDFPLTLDKFDSFLQVEKETINRETKRIEGIIRRLKTVEKEDFILKNLSSIYNNIDIPLSVAIENTLKRKIQVVLKSISNYDEKDKEVFKENLEKKYKKFEEYENMSEWISDIKNKAGEIILEFPTINEGLGELFDWQNQKAITIINFLRNHNFTTYFKGFDKFHSLYEEYAGLWQFDVLYYKITKSEPFLEPTPNDWFEGNFIQKIIMESDEYSGEKIIQSINNLLGENPFNKS